MDKKEAQKMLDDVTKPKMAKFYVRIPDHIKLNLTDFVPDQEGRDKLVAKLIGEWLDGITAPTA